MLSLFSRWNNEIRQYQPVPDADRQWLQTKLSQIKQKHGLDIISIDYVSPSNRGQAIEVANKIAALGFTPWVANPSLDYVGLSNIEVIPREILMLYDSRTNGAIELSEVHTLLAMPLEYMGYVPVYHNVADTGLPQGTLKGRYAGIVMWHREAVTTGNYKAWLHKHLDDKVPMAIFGSLGTDLSSDVTKKLGITPVSNIDPFTLRPTLTGKMVGFEAPPPARIDQFSQAFIITDDSNKSHLRFGDKNGTEIDAVVTGEWGGIAIHPTILDTWIEPIRDWIIDPFDFLKTSLQLIDAPMPDITTENGSRLWFAHIDGDAMPSWAELPGRNLGSEIIRDYIITEYELPHTISVVEAEMYTEDRKLVVLQSTLMKIWLLPEREPRYCCGAVTPFRWPTQFQLPQSTG